MTWCTTLLVGLNCTHMSPRSGCLVCRNACCAYHSRLYTPSLVLCTRRTAFATSEALLLDFLCQSVFTLTKHSSRCIFAAATIVSKFCRSCNGPEEAVAVPFFPFSGSTRNSMRADRCFLNLPFHFNFSFRHSVRQF